LNNPNSVQFHGRHNLAAGLNGIYGIGDHYRRGGWLGMKHDQFPQQNRSEGYIRLRLGMDTIFFLLIDPIQLTGAYPVLFADVNESNGRLAKNSLVFLRFDNVDL
jgi:hypothetical protein